MDCETSGYKVGELMDAPKNSIDFVVAAASFPPSLDNSSVVSIDCEKAAQSREVGEGPDEEFEANSFGPGNISLAIEGVPAWDKVPSSPTLSNDDANSNAGAGIRES